MTLLLENVGLVDRCSAYAFVQEHHYSAVTKPGTQPRLDWDMAEAAA